MYFNSYNVLLNKALKIIFKSTYKVECLIEVFRLTTWRWPRLHVVNGSSPVDTWGLHRSNVGTSMP